VPDDLRERVVSVNATGIRVGTYLVLVPTYPISVGRGGESHTIKYRS